MEQPRVEVQIEDPRSFWEHMRSRPRFGWLADRASDLVGAVMGAAEEQTIDPAPEESYQEWSRRRSIEEEREMLSASQVEPGNELDPFEYARYRHEQENWLTMEIGPGERPSGIMRRDFRGQSAYIGIENHSYGAYSDEAGAMFATLRKLRPNENVFLRSDPTFGRTEDGSLDYYDFPGGVADEIYVSQVYDKPPQASTCESLEDELAMTKEIARLLKPGGKALIFDYYRNLVNITDWLAEAGLKLRFVFRRYTKDLETGELVSWSEEAVKLGSELDCLEGDMVIIAEKPDAAAG